VLCSATVAMEDAYLLGKLFGSMFTPFSSSSSSSSSTSTSPGNPSQSQSQSLMSALNGINGHSRSSSVLGSGVGGGGYSRNSRNARTKPTVELHLPTALKSIDRILKTFDEMRCPSSSSSSSSYQSHGYSAFGGTHVLALSGTSSTSTSSNSFSGGGIPIIPLSSSSSSSGGRNKLMNIVERSVDAGIAFSGLMPSDPFTMLGIGSSRENGREADLSWVHRAL
jgi:hypothetical protein